MFKQLQGELSWSRELILLVKCFGIYNIDARILKVAKAVDPSESLSHTVKRGQVADHVVGGNVDAHLSRGRANQVYGFSGFGTPEESLEHWLLHKFIALFASHRAGEHFGREFGFFQLIPHLHGV